MISAMRAPVMSVAITLLALNLSLTVAFLDPDIGLRWLYYLAVLASFEERSNDGKAAPENRRTIREHGHWAQGIR